MKSALLPLTCLALSLCTANAASRFEEFTKKFQQAPDRAEVIASTFLGGAGTEWLAGGGFQPDGTIVVAGVTLGPSLELAATPVVLGTDGPISAPIRRPKFNPMGRPERDKEGQPKLEALAWNHLNATAFIARLSPDAKTVKSVTRVAWKSGGLTSAAVDGEGNIYIAGPTTTNASNSVVTISSDAQEFTSDSAPKRGGCAAVFLAKLAPDATKALWVRVIKGFSNAPELRLARDGKIHLLGPDARVFDANGKQISVTPLPAGEGHLAQNPTDGTWARGGEHHWPTGREPYRDPTLNIFKPDATLLYELYNWDGPFVGLNDLRLVSDSAIRGVTYDDDGNLLLHAWSDGGNSVLYREPNDIFTTSKNMKGLGLTAWGAGVLSCSYIIRIETQNYRIANGTLWVGYLNDRNKPNSVTINSLAVASDGSVCVAGGAAWGLIQTGNAFPGDPTGDYVAVMSKDLTSLRYCSTLPGTGQTEVADAKRWAFASGNVNGKSRVVILSGANADERTAPTKNALQEKFGGGFSDGHLLLLDLSANTK